MVRRLLFGLGLLTALAASAAAAARCDGPACGGELLFVGTHTGGAGQGIFAARLDPATGALTSLGLAAAVDRPTWLQRDPKRPILYSVSETGNRGDVPGSVFSLAIDRGSGRLAEISKSDSGGGGATHLAYDPRAATVFVANYAGGQVAAIPVGSGGRLGGVVSVAHNYGTGPNKRQTGPHAHGVTVDPSGRYVLSPDLGADRVFVYRWDAARRELLPAPTPFAALPPGSGPRHLVFSPDGRFAFLDTELTAEVYTLRWDSAAGTLAIASHIALDAPDAAGTRSAAEIATSADGRFLYVSNRGANLMQVFTIDTRSGALREIQRTDCGGESPWSFGLDTSGHGLIVANEASSNLAVFSVDPSTGRLAPTANRLEVPKPVAIAYVR